MTWVVFAILGYVVIHTAVNFGFRKPEPAHEPAAEAAERAKHRRFVTASMNGWTRLAATIAPDANPFDPPPRAPAPIERAARQKPLERELPLELVGLIPEEPSLHAAPAEIAAPATLETTDVLRLHLKFSADEKNPPFGETLAYAKDNRLFLLVQDEKRVAPDTHPVVAAPGMVLALPAGALAAGQWHATLHAHDAALSWTFVVK